MEVNLEPKKDYNPEMHTTEHILNQTMVRMFNCGRSFNAHIETKKSKCDYRLNRDLTEIEVTEIENRLNNVINSNLDVTEEFYSIEEADKLFDTSKLPHDSGTKIRVIKVGDYDACPCRGFHVSNTNEIKKFKIISHNFNGEFLRIRFKLISD